VKLLIIIVYHQRLNIFIPSTSSFQKSK